MVEPKQLEWTDDLIDRFWAFHSRTPDVYFTAKYGHRILAYVRKYLKGNPRILDFGCGSGALTGELLHHGYQVYGTDVSAESVESVRASYGSERGFLGASTLADLQGKEKTFDVVFLIEVIEHLKDEHLDSTLRQIRRLLVAGGILIVTTPNHEQLDQNTVYCPNCNSVFHMMQHMRSWSQKSLLVVLRRHAFGAIETSVTDFTLDPGRKLFWYFFNRLLYATGKRVPPHLVAIASNLSADEQ